jgi:DNA repair exonuclease SbcCD ATPase subunit
MSFGDNGVVIKLDRSPTTLITGTNGSGKSSIAEAITFALFGKSFRGVNKPDLVNTTNQKGCFVKIIFTKNENSFVVSRGIKPNIFTIEKDGIPLKEDSDVKDFQEVLDEILGFTYADYIKSILVGHANYKPLMQLSLPERRSFVDSMLNVGVYTSMAALNKVRLNDWKASREELNIRIDSINAIISSAKEAYKKVKEIGEEREVELREKISEKKKIADSILIEDEVLFAPEFPEAASKIQTLTDEKSSLVSEVKSLMEKKSQREQARKDLDAAHSKRAGMQEVFMHEPFSVDPSIQVRIDEIREKINSNKVTLALITSKVKSINGQIEFFKTETKCSVCSQDIQPHHSSSIIDAAKNEVASMMVEYKACSSENEFLSTELNSLSEELASQIEKEKSVKESISKAELARISIEMADADIEQKTKKLNSFDLDYDDTAKKLAERVSVINTEIETLNEMISKDNEKKMAVIMYNNQITVKKNQKNSVLKEIEEAESELEKFLKRDDGKKFLKDIEDNVKKLNELNAKSVELDNRKKVLDAATELLKDSGIKASVVKMYVPVLNQLINNYLEKMGASYQIVLDENFNDSIKGRYKDEFSYKSLSQGERQRIDLAALFACRKVSQMSSGSDSNLLILDEVGDSSMDFDGIEALFQIIEETCKDKNVFLVSHRVEMQDKCRSVIRLEKQNGFTKLV